jgi:hypothetical protein
MEVRPLRFDDRTALVESLRGAAALYNTYWVRFNYRTFSYALTVDNTLRLRLLGSWAASVRVWQITLR